MVIFYDFFEAERASQVISELRQNLGVFSEFKFNKTHPKCKEAFFSELSQFDFKVISLVVNKHEILDWNLRKKSENFYNLCVQELMLNDEGILQNASIKIDGGGSQEFKRAIVIFLRKKFGQIKIKKIKFVNSRSDNLIQLADMCVGAVARSYNPNREDSGFWLEKLKEAGKIQKIIHLKKSSLYLTQETF